MYSSGNNQSLLEPGLRKKKKKAKMERGETGWYDPVKAKDSENKADIEMNKLMKKKMGVKW